MSKNKIQAVRTFLGVLHVFREDILQKLSLLPWIC